ncbi:MAG: hypothetical protein COA41_12375 [Sphingopyxis sp.]|nr:MAG: hypothetical protein COA41_12375 [Sphingopyxis sp.]
MISGAPIISALVATHAPAFALLADRVYQDQAPQDVEFPCATFVCVFDDPQNHLRGRSSLKRQRWQLDVWSKSHAEADEVATAVQDALLTGDSGAVAAWLGEPTLWADFANQEFGVLAPISVVINSTQPEFERDSGLRRFVVDFTLWFYS